MTLPEPHGDKQVNPSRDKRVGLPLGPEAALRALLAVKPDEEVGDSPGQPE